MRKSYSKQDKEKIITQYESGVSIASIHNSTGIARSTHFNCIIKHNFNQKVKPLNRREYIKYPKIAVVLFKHPCIEYTPFV